jgi:tRNA A-37 threonylcarbamoyl transferase component Bud32
MTPASLEGQTLGRYRVLEPLGRGGMARVYRAYHPQLDRYVAIKVLRSDLMDDEEFLARFQREARAVAALRHPNIVQVFDFDVQGGLYYMVMELLEGDTLKRRLNDYRVRGERMPLGETVRILLDVLDGLAYAHSEGMVHRDIKPSNVLLTSRGQAVLGDFGIAQIVGGTRHTVSGALMGTLSYMAPEQGMEGHSDVRSDIYSLGIILYEMLIQRPPFEADTPLAVLMKHVNDPLPLPRAIDPDLPEPFERLVLKALSKGPDDRYPSAEEMAQALRMAAEDAGVELPTRISLPLSFTTDEAPEESVAVFSGTARERIADVEFAADDTDASLGQKLGVQLKEGGQTLREAGRELLSVVGGAAHAAIGKANQGLRGAVDSAKRARETRADERERPEEPLEAESAASGAALEERPGAAGESAKERRAAKQAATKAATKAAREARRAEARAKRAETRPKRRRIGLAVLSAVVLAIIGNLSMLTVEMPTGEWHIFERGWPIEIFLLGWGLCIVMYVAGSIWMLIPIGLALGTGGLLAYSSLTGNWEAWNYLWIFEVWIAVISLVTPIFLARGRGLARVLSRILAILLSLVAIGGIVVVGFIASSAVGVGDLLMGLRGLVVP